MIDFNQRVKIYSITIAVLLVLVLLGLWLSPTAILRSQARQPFLQFNVQEVGQIELGDLIIKRTNSVWVVQYKGQTFPALRDRADGYLKMLLETAVDRVVSSGGEGTDFGLTAETKPIVGKSDDGRVVFEFFPGSGTPDGRRVYVRLTKDGPIYAVDRKVASAIDRDLQSWVDNRVFLSIGSENLIMEVELTRSLAFGPTEIPAFAIRRTSKDGQEVWLDKQDRQVSDPRSLVTRLFTSRAMSHALAEDWPQEFQEVSRLRLRTEDNFWHELLIGKRDDQNRWPCEILGRKLWLGDWNFQDLKIETLPTQANP